MSVKRISGLGFVESKYADSVKTTSLIKHDADEYTVTIDHTKLSSLGNVDIPSIIDKKNKETEQKMISAVSKQIYSLGSGYVSFDTLFNDFNLVAQPKYNFWVKDERSNDFDDVGNRKLDDVPRYIHITWNVAPDTSKFGLAGIAPKKITYSKSRRNIEPVLFGQETQKDFSVKVRGIDIAPDHLRKDNFSLIRKSLANGYLSPGVIESIVEMPINVTSDSSDSHARTSFVNRIDEDSLLSNKNFDGISIHEMRANVDQAISNVIKNENLSANASLKKKKSLDDKFSSMRPMVNGGKTQMHCVASEGSTMSIVSKTAASKERSSCDSILNFVRDVAEPQSVTNVKRFMYSRVKFVHVSLGGLVDKKRIDLISEPHQAELIATFAQSLSNLEVLSYAKLHDKPRKIDIPSFPSPNGLNKLEYIGYVLQKYKKNSSGVFTLVDEIEFHDRLHNEYVDARVLYGETYRYRIRAIVRWTRDLYHGVLGKEEHVIGKSTSQTRSVSPNKSSYIAGEWSMGWSYASVIDTMPPPPPDELVVRPESYKKRICITFKLPENTQKDIFAMRLLRRLRDSFGRNISGWDTIFEVNSFTSKDDVPHNAIFFDEDISFFQDEKIEYVYAAQTISRHNEESLLSEQISARLNANVSILGEYPATFVSSAGVRRSSFGSFMTNPPVKRVSEVIVPFDERFSEFSIVGRESSGQRSYDDKKYLVRIESLDDGESKDFNITLTYNNMQPEVKTLTSGVVIEKRS